MISHVRKLASLLVATSLVWIGLPAVHAQTALSSDSATSASVADQKAQKKAQHKAARDKNRAEVKRLQDNGYGPGNNVADYPLNLQQADKKAASKTNNVSESSAAKNGSSPASKTQY